jgi:hypothetical protein
MERLEFPFLGEYFYLKFPHEYREMVDNIKGQLKEFLIFRIEKISDKNKIFNVNPVPLLDLYVPPVNVLVIVKVLNKEEEEKLSIEVSNSIYDILVDSMDKSGAGLLLEKNEKIIIDFYMFHEQLFLEGVKRFSTIYKSSGSFTETEKIILQQIEDKLKEANYKLIGGINLLQAEKIKKILDIFPSFIEEEDL